MLKAHKASAMETGIKEENIVIALNGQKVEVTKSKVVINGKVSAGVTLVDGLGVGDIGNTVIKDRQQLSQDGIVIINFTLSKESKKVLAGPVILTRGFVYVKDSADLIKEIERISLEKIIENTNNNYVEFNKIKNAIREEVGKYLYYETECKPMIITVIQEV